jgi:hypothetical protein
MHPNERFYKYYWWVFWNESPIDGEQFLSEEHRLSTAAAMQLLARLKQANEPCWLYNERIPRVGAVIPRDPKSPRWLGISWAPAYDEDPDPIWDDGEVAQR